MLRLACVFAVIVSAVLLTSAHAGGISLYAAPNPSTVGVGFDIYFCGEGGRYIYLEAIAPDGSEQSWVIASNGSGCSYPVAHAAAPVAGVYQITACKWSSNPPYECAGGSRVIAAAAETVE